MKAPDPKRRRSYARKIGGEGRMGLQTYRAKPNFDRTSEPRGRTPLTDGHSFVVQEHAARRLHYDLRLELDGVLKSWAVTRGPSLVPGDKRLAVEVEDHPLEYFGFEGRIPEGEYGAGCVIIWDRGQWEPEGDPHQGLAEGHLDFRLHGEKLKGRWSLIRMKPRRGETQTRWLLIKARDDEARNASDLDILAQEPNQLCPAATSKRSEKARRGSIRHRVVKEGANMRRRPPSRPRPSAPRNRRRHRG